MITVQKEAVESFMIPLVPEDLQVFNLTPYPVDD
jgi:hypothetical protein